MVYRIILPASLAAALSFTATIAVADGQKEPVYKQTKHDRVEILDRQVTRRAAVRVHYRFRYRPAGFHYRHVHHHHRAWDGLYGHYPRRHFFVDGVYTNGFYGPVNVGVVTYRTFVYYTPTYPSVSFGYPPYAHVYGFAAGPVYNKPCLC